MVESKRPSSRLNSRCAATADCPTCACAINVPRASSVAAMCPVVLWSLQSVCYIRQVLLGTRTPYLVSTTWEVIPRPAPPTGGVPRASHIGFIPFQVPDAAFAASSGLKQRAGCDADSWVRVLY